jgi:hypothetical protein
MTLFDDMIEKDGKKIYAYVMFLIIDETYFPASIVLAESIKNSGCLADLVIMIDNNISDVVTNTLKKFYDRVIRLSDSDIIKTKSKDHVQKHILTKLNGLKLDYKKVAIIDVDSIIFNHSNDIFDYDVPACIYNSSESKFNSGLMLLEPSEKDFDNLIKESNQISANTEKPLVYLIEKYYKNLYRIDEKYLKSNSSVDAYGIQYNTNKPFIIKNKISLEERAKWEHFKLWFNYFKQILTKYPELRDLKSLEQSIEISKYYLNQLGRFILKNRHRRQKIKREQVEELYGIKDKNSEYYHFNISKEYDSDDITYLFNNVTIGGFISYLKNKTRLLDSYLIVDTKTLNDIIKIIEPQYILDYLLSEYVRVMNNVYVVMYVADETEEKFELTRDLKENLIYKRKFVFPGIVLKNILFGINQNLLYTERVKLLSIYDDNMTYDINILIYQTSTHMNFNFNKSKIFIFNDTNSKIRFSSVFLNSNTLSRYSSNSIKLIKDDKINRKSIEKLLRFQTIKKWIYNNYSGDQLNNIIVIKDKPLTILDNNKYKEMEIKRIHEKKIKLINLIFTSGKLHSDDRKNYLDVIEQMYNPKKYYEIEGIKILC